MSSDSESREFHILVVEDNEADTFLLRRALKGAGVNCHLTVLTDGEAALDFLRDPERSRESGLPDLAVLDLNLPRNGGTEVLAALRLHPKLARIPVAVMTSSSSPQERAKAAELGVEQFFTKPPELKRYLEIGMILKEILLRYAALGTTSGAS